MGVGGALLGLNDMNSSLFYCLTWLWLKDWSPAAPAQPGPLSVEKDMSLDFIVYCDKKPLNIGVEEKSGVDVWLNSEPRVVDLNKCSDFPLSIVSDLYIVTSIGVCSYY